MHGQQKFADAIVLAGFTHRIPRNPKSRLSVIN